MKEDLKLKKYSAYWFIALLVTLMVGIILLYNEEFSIPCLLNFQFSQSLDEFKSLATIYNVNERLVIQHISMDFMYIILYTLLFVISIKVFEKSLMVKFPRWVHIMAYLPGIFDVIENIFMILLGYGSNSKLIFDVYFWSVRIKWAFAIILSMVVIAIMVYYIMLYIGKAINRSFIVKIKLR